MDLTIITYVSNTSDSLSALMAEIFGQSDGFELELLVVDGGCMRVDFEKVGKHCRDHGVKFSMVRQDPMSRHAPGYQVASKQAEGRTLVFLNPAFHIPVDFLKIADSVGRAGYALVPRSWTNVAARTTECWGFWAPPDGMTLIAPAAHFNSRLLDDIAWSSTPWAKADAYILASKLAAEHPGKVGMATVGGLEYRRWLASTRVAPYMSAVERDQVDVNDWILEGSDIRRYAFLGATFESVTERVPGYVPVEQIEAKVHSLVAASRARHSGLVSAKKIAPAVQKDLDAALDELLRGDKLVVRPEFIVEPVVEGGKQSVRIRSTGNVFLPYELVG